MPTNKIQIRNSTADFLVFTRQNGEDGIAVRIEDENVWLRAEAMATLFQKDRRTIQEHLKNIFSSGELEEISVCRNFRHTAGDGKTRLLERLSKPMCQSQKNICSNLN
ncbi:MAG: hypothetical protein LBN27_09805 [Prevotellaceae bacterium]|jgi:hypothetical protein|nr:hypothetical protein [Prevotellaceae bacterium]